ncbi:hypothetical protein CEXT_694431 [Caerostris extrusa]|uniref:Uncharacterized protein n=1 Tax=Caerostris extrusa TaxID=172846 RepID=A0AAV4Y0T6_CAEEX|nr:hypothetical protein CEXT_694431 [Caerostris extrusa]
MMKYQRPRACGLSQDARAENGGRQFWASWLAAESDCCGGPISERETGCKFGILNHAKNTRLSDYWAEYFEKKRGSRHQTTSSGEMSVQRDPLSQVRPGKKSVIACLVSAAPPSHSVLQQACDESLGCSGRHFLQNGSALRSQRHSSPISFFFNLLSGACASNTCVN